MDKKLKEILNESHKTILFILILISLLLRYGVSLNPYSGANAPPMFGDYEAQRHWMEITYNLPVKEWYQKSVNNDLLYWGLDYPPLTAYHSKLCGYLSNFINPDWVALNKSRGYESYDHKLFMRSTVFAADVLLFIPAVVLFFNFVLDKEAKLKQYVAVAIALCYPGLILVDHGHFQYNSISLGLALLAILYLFKEYYAIGSMFFVLALNYKQMELYHAFPFFFYLLGMCVKQKTWFNSLVKLCVIGVSVIVTFGLCWFPFLRSLDDVLAVVQRLFPFNRGLFEDKVGNIWCSLSVVVKLKNMLSQQQMVYLCLVTTLLSCLPSCINLLIYPTKKKFLFSLINCSLSFFLFSYQVHEKSILIAALPVCLVLFDSPLISTWFLITSTISMYPLLVRDGQSVSYFALLALFFIMCYVLLDLKKQNNKLKLLLTSSLLVAVLIHTSFAFVLPPQRLPDLYPLLFAVYSCSHFVLFWLYYNYRQLVSSHDDVPLHKLFTDDVFNQKLKVT